MLHYQGTPGWSKGRKMPALKKLLSPPVSEDQVSISLATPLAEMTFEWRMSLLHEDDLSLPLREYPDINPRGSCIIINKTEKIPADILVLSQAVL